MMRFWIIILLFPFTAFGQTNTDSLWRVWQNNQEKDTVRLKSLMFIIKDIIYDQPDSAFQLSQQHLKLAEKSQSNLIIAQSHHTIGTCYLLMQNYLDAIAHYQEAIKKFNVAGELRGPILSYNNLGFIMGEQGNHVKAIEYYEKALGLARKIKNEDEVAQTLNNLGIIYFDQSDFKTALDFYNQSLAIDKKNNYKVGMADTYYNIGLVYSEMGNFPKSIEYYAISREIELETKDTIGVAYCLGSLGFAHKYMGQLDSAMYYFELSLALKKKYNDEIGMATTYIGMSDIYNSRSNYNKARSLGVKALEIAQRKGSLLVSNDAANHLYQLYKKNGKHKDALAMYELKITLRDSLKSDQNTQAVVRQQFKYNYDMKHISDSLEFIKLQEIGDLAHQVDLQKEEKQRYVLYGGLIFFILLGAVAFRSYYRKKKDHLIISKQKEVVELAHSELEEKNQEIMDSITYAKRIQNAILPPAKVVKEYLEKSFILYKPKDIVAGDFYWMETGGKKVLFAAADCTGHGVPGAMVSVVCNNGLNRSVREHGLTDPGEILNKTREIVIQEFEKSEEEVKDGMDIALCSLEGKTLQYAGAHNPLWIIRNGEIIETKANKQPIGKFDNPLPYTTHTFELQQGDTIYIFSDGYVDQFGGEKGKKFKARAFRELLLSIQDKAMEEQKAIIDETFETWKGNLEQIDDVCIIGVRI